MSTATALALASLTISLATAGTTAFLTLRQIQLTGSGNHLPVVLNAFQHTRDAKWLEAEDYVLHKLAEEHSPEVGYRGLPEDARNHLKMIGLFYDDLGKLVAHKMIKQNLVIGSYGSPIVYLWDRLAPYIYAERRNTGFHFWVYFEDLAVRAKTTPPKAIYDGLRMKRRPPNSHSAPSTSTATAPASRTTSARQQDSRSSRGDAARRGSAWPAGRGRRRS